MKERIIVFGATGGTGEEVVKQALERGHNVTAFVRNPDKVKLSNVKLKVIKGNVLNLKEVKTAVINHDVVICCLGMPPSDKSNLRRDGTKNIIEAMKIAGISRLICQTSLGFGNSKELLPWHMKYIIVPFILKNAFKDHELQEIEVEQSKLNWTIVRPGNMTNGARTLKYKYGFQNNEKIKLKISRADVAHFMLQQVISDEHKHQKVGLSY